VDFKEKETVGVPPQERLHGEAFRKKKAQGPQQKLGRGGKRTQVKSRGKYLAHKRKGETILKGYEKNEDDRGIWRV